MELIGNLILWTEEKFEPLGGTGLFTLAFMESSFFPIPPDILLIVLALNRPELALWFALICTVGSVIGGMFGYFIGKVGKNAILEKFVSRRKIYRVHKLYNRYGAWAVGIAAFTPIPYKVFTISAGVFFINFKRFILASTIGRGGRFFLEAAFLMMFGERVVDFLTNQFNWLSLFLISIILVGYFVYRKFRNPSFSRFKSEGL